MLRIEVPPLMKNILKEINKAVLKAQSSFEDPDKIMTHDEIVEFLAVYLNTMSRLRDSTGEVSCNEIVVRNEIVSTSINFEYWNVECG